MNHDAIDADHRALAVVEPPAPSSQIAIFGGEPEEVIARAVKVADALKAVIQAKGLVKKIQGREFIEVAGWQTLATLCGVTTFCEWTKEVEGGWEARVVVRRNGFDIGAAEAECTRSEKTWASRDGYALRSMCQTRATSKALRSVLGFLAVLAGYEDTPASEVPDGGLQNARPSQPARAAQPPPQESDAQVEARRKEGVKQLHIWCRNRGIDTEQPDGLYKFVLRDTFGDLFAGKPDEEVSSRKLKLRQLQEFSKSLQAFHAKVRASEAEAGE
jgi:hypothetical protein